MHTKKSMITSILQFCAMAAVATIIPLLAGQPIKKSLVFGLVFGFLWVVIGARLAGPLLIRKKK